LKHIKTGSNNKNGDDERPKKINKSTVKCFVESTYHGANHNS
jgi:hypothetical protein